MNQRCSVVAMNSAHAELRPVSQIQRSSLPMPAVSPADRILRLQQMIGNQAVQRLLNAQAKLEIGTVEDVYEQEADRIADSTMQMPKSTSDGVATGSERVSKPNIQRLCSDCEEEAHRQPIQDDQRENKLSRKISADDKEEDQVSRQRDTAGDGVQSTIDSQMSGGHRLPESSRAFFERRMGQDFRHVRLHTDKEASRAADAINARAFTVGNHISFAANEYAPDTTAGQRLLAHELVHTVQQTGQTNAAFKAPRSQVKQHIAPRVQGKWRMDSMKTFPNMGINYTDDHGYVDYVSGVGMVYGSASAKQKTGWVHSQVGGKAQIGHSTMIRYIFKNDGKDNDFLQVLTHASVNGNAKAEAKYYGQSAAVVWGQVAERTASNPTPERKQLFDPVKAGGVSAATVGDLGTVDAEIPIGEGSININIPLKRVEQGDFAPFSLPLDATHESPTGISEVEVMVGAYMSAAADIETNVFGLAPWLFGSNENHGLAAGMFRVNWESRTAPVAPKAPGAQQKPGEPGGTTPGGQVGPAAAQCGMSRKPTPSGKVQIDKGPLKGKQVEYGDPRGKHTKVADCPVPDLKRAANDRNPDNYKGELKRFSQACQNKDTSYGSQLANNASSQSSYEALVKDALENGKERAGKYHHTAKSDIGVDVSSRDETAKYRVDVSSTGQGAHVIPLS